MWPLHRPITFGQKIKYLSALYVHNNLTELLANLKKNYLYQIYKSLLRILIFHQDVPILETHSLLMT